MNPNKDGGPAFPIPIAGCNDGSVYNTLEQSRGELGGMSLRDHFAAKALPVVAEGFPHCGTETAGDWAEWVARNSYALADAMLKAREDGQ